MELSKPIPKPRLFRGAFVLALLALAPGTKPLLALNQTYTVNSTLDTPDPAPGNGICGASGGPCTLRAAIQEANAQAGADTINFNIPGGGVKTITPTLELPTITSPVTINGYTQPGSSPATATTNAALSIELKGSPFDPDQGHVTGLTISAGNSTIRGLIINRFSFGINLFSQGGNVISGNYIGTDATGTVDLGNGHDGLTVRSPDNIIGGTTPAARNLLSGNRIGVLIDGAEATRNLVQGNFIGTGVTGTQALGNETTGVIAHGSDNTIGGTTAGTRNVISGNSGVGVAVGGSNNLVQGNFIGTDVTGTRRLGNGGNGGFISGSNNTVGGTTSAARNIISANGGYGVVISGSTAQGNKVQGNYIGTDITGTRPLGNGEGVLISTGASNNMVGGASTTPDSLPGNLISANFARGIVISSAFGNVEGTMIQGNRIGLGADGTANLGNGSHGILVQGFTSTIGGAAAAAGNIIAHNGGDGLYVFGGTGNALLRNSIFSNGGQGIDLGFDFPNGDGPTPNDGGDADFGPNNLQNFPVIITAGSTITGTFNSKPGTRYRLEFFANDTAAPSGFGEGQRFIGTMGVVTNQQGNASFTFTPVTRVPAGQFVTATASDPSNNTSEFSRAVQVEGDPPGTLQFSAANYSINEHGVSATITVRRVGGSSGAVGVSFATDNGMATAGSDYTARSGTLNWANGDITNKTFTVPIINDTAIESTEFLNLTLSNPTGGASQGAPAAARLTIFDNDLPRLSISDVTVTEGNAGTVNAVFTVTLSPPRAVTVNFATADGTATAGSDYTAASGSLSFGPQDTTRTITVVVRGDTVGEANETFFVNLSSPAGATLADPQGVGTITNDDLAANLTLVQTDTPNPAMVGLDVTYILTVTNNGPNAATGVTLIDTLPQNSTFLSSTPTGTRNGNTVRFELGTLNPGASVTVRVMVQPTLAGSMTNSAVVSSAVSDPVPGNNSASESTTIQNPGTCATDRTASVRFDRTAVRPVGSYLSGLFGKPATLFVQTVTITNTSQAPLGDQLSLVLDNPSGGTLLGVAGTTACAAPLGSPFVNVNLPNGNALLPGEAVTVELRFEPGSTAISYTPRLLSGPGPR